MPQDGIHQIGYVADRVGLSLRTVRYYEEIGLVEPSGRTDGGFRLYTEEDIARLELVKQLKPLEFSLDELRELFDLRDRLEHATGEHRREVTDRFRAYLDLAEQRCERLREQLAAADHITARLRHQLPHQPKEVSPSNDEH